MIYLLSAVGPSPEQDPDGPPETDLQIPHPVRDSAKARGEISRAEDQPDEPQPGSASTQR